MKRSRLIAAIAIAALVIPLSACSASSAGSSRQSADSASSAEVSSEIRDSSDGSGGSAATAEGSIIRSASLELEVSSTDEAAKQVADVADEFDGDVVSQYVSSSTGRSEYGEVEIRVPTARLDDAVSELSTIGTVRSERRSAQDVTAEHVDLTARVAALETSVERLTKLMSEAASTTELLEAESALSQRQQELDGLTAQLKALEGQVEQANISVQLSEPNSLPGGGPKSFWDAIVAGTGGLGSFLSAAFIAFGLALPWLALLAVIAAAIVLPIRARRKRRSRTGQARTESGEKSSEQDAAESVVDSQGL